MMETLISQGKIPNLEDQGFTTIGTTRYKFSNSRFYNYWDQGSMFFSSKTRASIINGCSISSPSISFPFFFGSTIGGFILVILLRFSQNLSLMVLNYLKVPLSLPRPFNFLLHITFFQWFFHWLDSPMGLYHNGKIFNNFSLSWKGF